MSKHTPGPFSITRANKPVDGAYDYAITAEFEGKKQVIAECFGRTSELSYPDAFANAHLFKSAPELLHALRGVMDLIESGYLVRNIEEDHKPDFAMRQLGPVGMMKIAMDAIRKAEGENNE